MEQPVIDRRKWLGGSDIAAILGVSPYKTPLQLWNDKTVPAMPENNPERLKVLNRGKRLEPYILDMLRAEHGIAVVATNQRYIDKVVDFFACEIDFEAEDETRGHINGEIKTVHPFKAKEWGDEYSDALPVHYVAQVQWGMGITGREHTDVYALIGDDLRRYEVLADAELIETMRERAESFWREYVLTLTPPPPANEADLYRLHPNDDGSTIAIDNDTDALAALNELRALKDEEAAVAARIAECERSLKTRMGDAAALALAGRRVVTWKTQSSRRFDQKAFSAAQPDLFAQFLKKSESRVFRVS